MLCVSDHGDRVGLANDREQENGKPGVQADQRPHRSGRVKKPNVKYTGPEWIW